MPEHFRVKLARRQEALGSALCVGLDPDMDQMPERFRMLKTTDSLKTWMKMVIVATSPFASMYKFQIAHYEAIPGGVRAMWNLVRFAKSKYPDIPVFIDAKRGDTDRTQQKYRTGIFDIGDADGTNVCCYMGSTPLLKMYDPTHPERAIVNLVYTSNPDAREVQEALMADGDPLWLFMAKRTIAWSEQMDTGRQNVGFVMAAAYDRGGNIFDDHLRRCRAVDQGVFWYLMPGFGAQGGFVEASVKAAWMGHGSIAMNASSSICNAEKPALAAEELHRQIADAIQPL